MSQPTSRGARRSTRRSFRPELESLENRQLMTASAAVTPPLETAALVGSTADTSTAAGQISQITVRVGDKTLVLNQSNSTLPLVAGQAWSVSSVDFLTGKPATADDQYVLEGYVRTQPADASGTADFDYANGKYSTASQLKDGATAGTLAGLSGEWKAELGQDRLVVSLVRYAPDAPNGQTVAQFFVQLSVGSPAPKTDFRVSGGRISQPRQGQATTIYGSWLNDGTGRYQNYAEVDVFRDGNFTVPVWVGTLSGVSVDGQKVTGEFLNNNPNDAYASRWTPDRSGRYVIRFYADPENTWQESNESNNISEVKVQVTGRSSNNRNARAADLVFGDYAANQSVPTNNRRNRHVLPNNGRGNRHNV